MNRLTTLAFLFATTLLLANEPQITITYKNAINGYGTVAGKVISPKGKPVGITVLNGGLKFSTVSDPQGTWGVVFPHRSINLEVTAWNLDGANEVVADLMDRLESHRP